MLSRINGTLNHRSIDKLF